MTQSTGELEDFLGCIIKRELTKMILKISHLNLISNMNQGFNKGFKLLMTFNTPATPHKRILCNQEIETKISHDLHKIYRSGVGSLL